MQFSFVLQDSAVHLTSFPENFSSSTQAVTKRKPNGNGPSPAKKTTNNKKELCGLEGEARKLWKAEEHSKALSVFDELLPKLKQKRLDIMLMVAECELHIGRDAVVTDQRMENDMKRILKREIANLKTLLSRIDLILNDETGARALILIKWTNQWLSFLPGDGNIVPGQIKPPLTQTATDHLTHYQLLFKTCETISKMANEKYKAIALYHGMPLAFNLLRKVSQNLKESNEKWVHAECLQRIGFCYHQLGLYDEAINFSFKCIEVMKEAFANVADDYQTTADAYANIGNSYLVMEKFDEAMTAYGSIPTSVNESLDFQTKEMRQKISDKLKIYQKAALEKRVPWKVPVPTPDVTLDLQSKVSCNRSAPNESIGSGQASSKAVKKVSGLKKVRRSKAAGDQEKKSPKKAKRLKVTKEDDIQGKTKQPKQKKAENEKEYILHETGVLVQPDQYMFDIVELL